MTGTRQQRSLWCRPVLHEAIIALQAATRRQNSWLGVFPNADQKDLRFNWNVPNKFQTWDELQSADSVSSRCL
jgi:hypothetical protein